jgi:hypothetical protein
MSDDVRTKPTIVRMREGIQKIRPLVASEDFQISQEKVREISNVSEELIKSLSR